MAPAAATAHKMGKIALGRASAANPAKKIHQKARWNAPSKNRAKSQNASGSQERGEAFSAKIACRLKRSHGARKQGAHVKCPAERWETTKPLKDAAVTASRKASGVHPNARFIFHHPATPAA